MKKFKIWYILSLISVIGLFIIFIYSICIKEYMQALMCITLSAVPMYVVITTLKKNRRKNRDI